MAQTKRLLGIFKEMRHLHAFAFLALAAMAFSCDAPTTIGSELQPDELLIKTAYTDTFTLRLRSFQYDSVNTMTASLLMAGYVNDENFGKISAQSYIGLTLLSATEGVTLLGTGATSAAVLDSVFLYLNVGYAYGDSSRADSRRIHVRTLQQAIDTTGGRRYYQFDKLALGETVVDTVVQFESGTSSLALKPNASFSQFIFNKAAAGDISSLTALQGIIKGLGISSDNSGQSIYGFTSATSSMRFHYHYMKGVDTIRTTFSLYTTGFRFNNIDVDRSGTPLAFIADTDVKSEDVGNIGFLQAGTSVGTRIVLPDLTAYGLANKVVINRAELWFTPVPGSHDPKKTPPPSLYLLTANEFGRPYLTSTGNYVLLKGTNGADLISNYITGGQTYAPVDVTYYAEQLANDQIDNNGFILHPSTQQSNAVNAVRLGDSKHGGEFPMSLRIYYTKFN